MKITYRGLDLEFDGVPTQAQLDAAYEAKLALTASIARRRAGIQRRDLGAVPPLSSGQRRMWLLQRMSPDSYAYTVPQASLLRGKFDLDAARAALTQVRERHEILRTVFPLREGVPFQRILEPSDQMALEFVDLCDDPAAHEAAREMVRSRVTRPFNLEVDPPFRVSTFQVSDDEYVLLFVYHHIAIDEWSNGVLIAEFGELYASLVEGRPSVLMPPQIQFADYAIWEAEQAETEQHAEGLAFWGDYLRGVDPRVSWPFRNAETEGPAPTAHVTFEWSAETSNAIRALARKNKHSDFVIVYALTAAFLWRYTGDPDIVVAVPATLRERAELQTLIGFLLNTLLLRSQLHGDETFGAWSARAGKMWTEVVRHQRIPFDEVVRTAREQGGDGPRDYYEVMLSYVSREWGDANFGDFELSRFNFGGAHLTAGAGQAREALNFSFSGSEERMSGVCEYDANRFEARRIAAMLERFEHFAAVCMSEPDAPMQASPLLPPDDPSHRWSTGRRLEIPQLLTHELFEEQAARQPDATAVLSTSASWSYAGLNRRANRIAHTLIAMGVRQGTTVGVSVERSPELIATLLGVLKAGAAYVALQPDLPERRIAYMTADSGVQLTLTDDMDRSSLRGDLVDIHAMEDDSAAAYNPGVPVAPESLAYILYTSGSTGLPKGVMLPHRAVRNLVSVIAEQYPVTSADVILQKTPYSFDISVSEIFNPLASGAKLLMTRPEDSKDPSHLRDLILEHGVTVLRMTPTELGSLLSTDGVSACATVVRRVLACGEALTAPVCRTFDRHWSAVELVNLWGPTEACVYASWWPYDSDRGDTIPIGKPLPNYDLFVLDGALDRRPVGLQGELYAAGPSLARGYHGLPTKTALAYLPNPYDSRLGARMYKSGDVVSWADDGEQEFHGRVDSQVQLRGMRIELGELESALEDHPGVRHAAVVPLSAADGRVEALAAYVALRDPDLAVAELREHLRGYVEESKIPGQFIVLEEMPKTASGKIDRTALPDPGQSILRVEYVAPATKTEEKLAVIWEALLDVDNVGRSDNFFEIGGHSLLAVRLQHELHQALGVDVALARLLELPNIAALAAWLDEGGGNESGRIEPRDCGDEAPLSSEQRRMWFLQQLNPESVAYHVPVPVRLRGELNADAILAALRALSARHEILRTIYPERDGEPIQQILPTDTTLSWAAANAATEDEGLRILDEAVDQPFDLTRTLPMRATLVKVADDHHFLLLLFHHIAIDEWTSGVLVSELSELYAAATEGRPSTLPALPLQYADYAVWQQAQLKGPRFEESAAFWRDHLSQAPDRIEWPFGRSGDGSRVAANVRFDWDAATTAAIQALARRHGATDFVVLYAMFSAFLARASGQRDLTIGVPVTMRQQHGLQGLVGFLLNTLPMRAAIPGDVSFEDWLDQTQAKWLETAAHQWLPLDEIVGTREGAPAGPPFDTMFTFLPSTNESFGFAGLKLTPLEMVRSDEAKTALIASMTVRDGRFVGEFEYDAGQFDEASIQRLAAQFGRFTESCLARPAAPLIGFELLESGEQGLLVEGRNVAKAPLAAGGVHGLFEAWAARLPDAIAAEFGEQTITYGALDQRANQIAHGLRVLGAGPGTLVGLCMQSSIDLLACMLAILKSGAGYLPLDPVNPADRLEFMLTDAGAGIVVTDPASRAEVPKFPGQTVEVHELALPTYPSTAPEVVVEGEDVAYVMFTSGSTGTPKGIVIPHRAIIRLVRETNYVAVEPHHRLAQAANTAFDAATYEIWGALLNGARLVGVPKDIAISPERFVARLREAEITHLFITTALFNLVAELVPDGFSTLQNLMFGGEAVEPKWVRSVLESGAPDELLHVYGPTECTTYATFHPVENVAASAASVPIGGPIGNTSIYVVDPAVNPVGRRHNGQLLIGGAGLAHGYLNRSRLTALKFTPDPFGKEAGGRLYATGDLVRWNDEAAIEFVGRVDHQVKVRGFRIELGAIESVLAANPSVGHAVVVVQGTGSQDRRIVAFLRAGDEGADLDDGELADTVRASLPEFMVPSAFVYLDAFPMTPTGKIDRKALPDAAQTGGQTQQPPATPTEQIIAQIWHELLGSEIGRHDNFFEIGGHSLLAVKVQHALAGAFEIVVPLDALFQHPVLTELAAWIEDGTREAEKAIPRHQYGSEAPVSSDQRRMWLMQTLHPESVAYHVQLPVRLTGELNADAMRNALAAVVARHEILRTIYPAREGGPVQKILPATVTLNWAFEDLSGQQDPTESAKQRFEDSNSIPFDIQTELPLRALLLRVGPNEHVLQLLFHHIAIDEWTTGVLLHEVSELYAAEIAKRPSELAAPSLQYADYTLWQQEQLAGPAFGEGLEFWSSTLEGASPNIDWPIGEPPKGTEHPEGSIEFDWDRQTSEQLRSYCRSRATTEFIALYAGFTAFLAQYTGQRDVSIGVPVTMRQHSQLRDLVGLVLNTAPMRACTAANASFDDCVERTMRDWRAALPHHWIPLEEIVRTTGAAREAFGAPLFDTLFTFVPVEEGQPSFADLKLSMFGVDTHGDAKVALNVHVGEHDGQFSAEFRYDTARFDREAVAQLVASFERFVGRCLDQPKRPIHTHPQLTEAGERVALDRARGATLETPAQPVHELFAALATQYRDRIALSFDGGSWSYGELVQRANGVARHLLAHGVGPEVPVGVSLERSPELVAALLGVLMAGGAYVALPPDLPSERLLYMAMNSGAQLILCDGAGELAAAWPVDTHHINEIEADHSSPDVSVDPDNLAYILYTSGSTGRPKGVEVRHAGMLDHVSWMAAELSVTESEVFLLKSSYGFDVSVSELFVPLTTGGSIFVAPPGAESDPAKLLDLLDRVAVDTVRMVPTALQLLVGELEARSSRLNVRRIALGGETLAPELIARLRGVYDGEIFNMYGLTETSVTVTCQRVVPDGTLQPVPIGRPVANQQAHVLSQDLQLVSEACRGELYVGGAGLGRGYRDQPRKTAETFVPSPWSDAPGARLYRTGDITSWRADGSLAFHGRRDGQIQLRGIRVELGEIEVLLANAPGVRQAAVRALDISRGRAESLVGYLLLEEGMELDVPTLREHLSADIPDALIPGWFTVLEAMPRTASGKLDRNALPAPNREGSRGDLEAARNDVEELLVEIWKRELGLKELGVHENFFAVGGDSLKVMQIVSRLREAGLAIAPADFIQHQTIAELAKVSRDAAIVDEGPIEGEVPLAPIQRRFFDKQYEFPEQKWQLRVIDAPDWLTIDLLRLAAAEVVNHHDSLRLRFESTSHGWRQWYGDRFQPEIVIVDVAGLDRDEARRRLTLELSERMNLRDAPLIQLGVVESEGACSEVVIIVHFLIADAFSFRTILRDINLAGSQLSRGEEPELMPISTSYQRWVQALSDAPFEQTELDYWLRDEFTEVASRLATDHPRTAENNREESAQTHVLRLSADVTSRVRASARQTYGLSDQEILLAALSRALSLKEGVQSIAMSIRGHGRDTSMLDDVILDNSVGWFVALHPVPLATGGEFWPGPGLTAVKEEVRRIPSHGVGYGVLRHIVRDTKLRALAEPDVVFNYFGAVAEGLDLDSGSTSVTSFIPDRGHNERNCVLEVFGALLDGEFVLGLEYSKQLHDASTIAELATNIGVAIQQISEHCEALPDGVFTPSDFANVSSDRALTRNLTDALNAAPPRRTAVEDILRLAPMQRGMLFDTILGTSYVVQQVMQSVPGHELDVDALKRAWELVVERHAALRAEFHWDGFDEAIQLVKRASDAPLRFTFHDLTNSPAAGREERFRTILEEDQRDGVDLTKAPLMRLTLVRLDDVSYRLLITRHHIISDGWSSALIFRETADLYERLRGGELLSATPDDSYRAYFDWVRQQDLDVAAAYWRSAVGGAEWTRFPEERTSESVSAVAPPESKNAKWTTPPEWAEKLMRFAERKSFTPNTVLSGLWAMVLARHSGQRDVVFGNVVSGRGVDVPGIERRVGLFINSLPIRVSVSPAASANQWFTDLHQAFGQINRYSFCRFSDVRRWAEIGPRTLQKTLTNRIGAPTEESDPVWRAHGGGQPAYNALSGFLDEIDGRFQLAIDYDPTLFRSARIEALLHDFAQFGESIFDHPSEPLAAHMRLGDTSRQRLVERSIGPMLSVPNRSFHELFSAQAEREPGRVALSFSGGEWTYGELDRRANGIAAFLREKGIGPDVVVGISIERSPALVASLLGVMKAGGAYVALQPDLPAERLQYMLADSGASLLLCDAAGEAAADCSTEVFSVDQIAPTDAQPGISVDPENLAYVLYTSGSTGRPKGVAMRHSAVTNLLTVLQHHKLFSEDDVVLWKTPYGFDVSVSELYNPLICGARIVVTAPGAERDPTGLVETIREHGVTVLRMVPSALEMLIGTAGFQQCTTIRAVICAGEALSRATAQRFFAHSDGELYNLLGATETTVDTTFWRCERGDSPALNGVGVPLPNYQTYVLDAAWELALDHVQGELYVGGAGLARGYRNMPTRTAISFLPNPFATSPGARMYRTGDVVAWNDDGGMEYIGRADSQLQVRGVRVEPLEVEALLSNVPGVSQAVVIGVGVAAGHADSLIAYVVFESGGVPTASELRAHLGRSLPAGAIPSQFVRLDSMPRTSSGKIDRKALPASNETGLRTEFVPPASDTEKRLATIWCDLLDLERVSRLEDFFNVGGHSLLAVRVMGRIEAEFGVRLTVRQMVGNSQLAALAEAIDESSVEADDLLSLESLLDELELEDDSEWDEES